MPTNLHLDETLNRIRSKNSDQNLVALAKRIAMAYGDDKVRLLSFGEVRRAVALHDIDAINKVIANVPQMSTGQRLDFCDAFVGEDMSGLDLATPMILGDAYRAIFERARDGEAGQQERLDKITARIDDLSTDFANSGGMIVSQNEWPLVDTNNIADVYEGFTNMLNARMAEIDATKNLEKMTEIQENLRLMQNAIENYDDAWGLRKLRREDAEKLSARWDGLYDALNRAELSENTKIKLSKYKFLDSKNQVIPQFISGKRGDTEKYEEYEPGFRIVKGGRLASVVELARHDVAKKHVADSGTNVDEEELEFELNDAVLTKLFEIDSADKVVRGAMENPEQFADPKYREEFINNLAQDGGEISDAGYNAAIDAQMNATAGWAARIKNKIGAASDRAKGFFGRVFQPIKHIDKMADVRMTRRTIDKREKRIEFFTRILKGFASGFIASAIITTIATAAAAAAGVSVAMSLAAIGIVTTIGMGVIQITRWRKAQEAAGLPTDINAFLKDKRLVASLGASLLAVVAMCFGVAGLATAAKWLGYSALAIGGSNNAVAAFRDARDAKMSAAESIAWAIANAGAVIGGGFAGRAVAHAGINVFNEHNPRNTIFQSENTHTELQETTTTRDTTETRLEYTQDALDNAERIARMWYRDNPEILQQRVDAINVYNVEHGTSIDPYRAIMINGDAGGQTFDNMRLHVNNSHIDSNINDVYSHGSHRVLTDWWADKNNISHDVLHAARHLFDGPITEVKMNAIAQLDNLVSDRNTVGSMQGRPIHTDNYFKPNDPAGWTTYTDGNAAKVENIYPSQESVTTTTTVDYKDYTPARGDGMAMFGNYTPRERLKNLRDRVGSFLDRVRGDRRNEPVTEDVPPIVPDEEKDRVNIETTDLSMGEPKSEDLSPFVPAKEESENEEIFNLEPIVQQEESKDVLTPIFPQPVDETRPEPEQNEYMVPPISSKKLFPEPLFKDIKRPGIEPSRVQEPVQPVQSGLENMTVALTIPEIKKYEPYYDFALTEDQAERWNTLNKELGTTLAKMRNRSTHADDYMRLRKQANRLTDEINSFTAELGNPTASEIGQALAEIERRKKLKDSIAQYNRHMAKKPSGDSVSDWRNLKWESEQAKLLDKIEALGGWDSLDESKLRFATPKPGRLKQKLAEIAQREADRQQPQRVFEMPMHEEQPEERLPLESEQQERDTDILPKQFEFNHQKPDFENRYPRDKRLDLRNHTMTQPVLGFDAMWQHLISYPLMEIRGVPVKLLDLDGHTNPITNNDGRAMVVVDIDGLRIPFYLANGNEPSGLEIPGNWYPMFSMMRDGKWFFGRVGEYINDKSEGMAVIKEIAAILNARIGDIRNHVYNIPHVSTSRIYSLVGHTPNNLTEYMIWAPSPNDNELNAHVPWLRWYLNNIQSPDYEEYVDRRQARRERRKEFFSGIGNFADRVVRGRLFGRNDDSKEYE